MEINIYSDPYYNPLEYTLPNCDPFSGQQYPSLIRKPKTKPFFQNICSCIIGKMTASPNEKIYTILDDNGKEISSFTYAFLLNSAISVANTLKDLKIHQTSHIGMLFKRSEMSRFIPVLF
jgi:hypothetical protein